MNAGSEATMCTVPYESGVWGHCLEVEAAEGMRDNDRPGTVLPEFMFALHFMQDRFIDGVIKC